MPHTRRRLFHASVFALILASNTALSDPTPAHSHEGPLVIHVQGFENARGHAVAKLYWPGEDVLGTPHALVRAAILDGKANLTFPDVPYGTYAVVVFHDENDNGTIDHNFLRLPVEPLGFSNGFKVGIFSGMPSFKKLAFPFIQGSQGLDIDLK